MPLHLPEGERELVFMIVSRLGTHEVHDPPQEGCEWITDGCLTWSWSSFFLSFSRSLRDGTLRVVALERDIEAMGHVYIPIVCSILPYS